MMRRPSGPPEQASTTPAVPRANQLASLTAAIERVARLDVPADAALSAYFREHRELGVRDRAFVAEGAFAYLRRKRSLETLAGTTSAR